MARELEKHQLIERSIQKKYRKEIWNKFISAVKQYELIKEGDRIAVCISGGKDSMLLAKLMQLLKMHSDVPFELTFLVMDPGYNKTNLDKIISNAEELKIPITIFKTNIFSVADNVANKSKEKLDRSACYLCAKMRRGHLYSKAKELGCNKIALGHHFSDVVETTVLGMFYGSQLQAMMPKLRSKNFENMELIRPMFMIHEDSILAWCRYNNLEFIRCACLFTDTADCDDSSKRKEIKNLIKELKKTNPNIEKSIFSSIHNCMLDTMITYKTKGETHSFLDNY